MGRLNENPSTPGKRVLLLVDTPFMLTPENLIIEHLGEPEWESERSVYEALCANYDVSIWPLHDDVRGLVKQLTVNPPDVVFNLCESLAGDRNLESNIASLLELLGVPFTGEGSAGLRLCKDKAWTKKLLAFHGVRIPQFKVFPLHEISAKTANDPVGLKESLHSFLGMLPGVVKPRDLDSSEGIAQSSLVNTRDQIMKRVKFIHETYGRDAILEEYIPGRELYVGVFEGEVFPVRELVTKTEKPWLATYRWKWDEDFRKDQGIHTRTAQGLTADLQKKIQNESLRIYQLLQLKGHARIDYRLDAEGIPVFLEANPNPSMGPEDDFALAALEAGLDYDALVHRIVENVKPRC